MPDARKRRVSKESVKRAADRAEAASSGLTVGDEIEAHGPLNPPVVHHRPTDYSPEMDAEAEQLSAEGCTDEELAHHFGISVRQLYRWKAKYKSFRQSIKEGADRADDRVVNTLYRRAIGYEQDAVKIFMPAGSSEPVYAPYREAIAPDVTAQIFWLKNRQSGKWRDRREVETTVTLTVEDRLRRAIDRRRMVDVTNDSKLIEAVADSASDD